MDLIRFGILESILQMLQIKPKDVTETILKSKLKVPEALNYYSYLSIKPKQAYSIIELLFNEIKFDLKNKELNKQLYVQIREKVEKQ